MGKTSFKDLLAKGGSNPLVNLQSLKDQRRKVDELKQRERAAAAAAAAAAEEPPAKRRAIAAAAPPGARAVAAPADAPAGFLACASFAGARPGYTFKAGPAGVGYYLEDAEGAAGGSSAGGRASAGAVAATAEADDAGAGAGGAAPSLPGGFFDNPQEDPSNRGREVAATNKEQQLREEMDEFNKLVRADIETAKANDAEEIEEEADLSQLQALQEQVQLSKRVDGLHDMRQKALVVAARVAQEVAATKAERAAAAADDGDPGAAPSAAREEEEEEDDDDEDDGGLSSLDWRARGFA